MTLLAKAEKQQMGRKKSVGMNVILVCNLKFDVESYTSNTVISDFVVLSSNPVIVW